MYKIVILWIMTLYSLTRIGQRHISSSPVLLLLFPTVSFKDRGPFSRNITVNIPSKLRGSETTQKLTCCRAH